MIDLTEYYYEDRIERIKKEIKGNWRDSFKRRIDWEAEQMSPFIPTPIPPQMIVKKKRKLLKVLKLLLP